jgi:hypothetical protein
MLPVVLRTRCSSCSRGAYDIGAASAARHDETVRFGSSLKDPMNRRPLFAIVMSRPFGGQQAPHA